MHPVLEAFQFTLSMSLLGARTNVVIEWGVWSRRERDALHDAPRADSVRPWSCAR